MDARLRLLIDAYFAQQRALDRLEEVVFTDAREQNLSSVDLFSALEFGYGIPETRMQLRLIADIIRSRLLETSSSMSLDDFDEMSFRLFIKHEDLGVTDTGSRDDTSGV